MQYEDFDVSIEATSGRAYRVAVLHSPAGQAHETVTFPFDKVAIGLLLGSEQKKDIEHNVSTIDLFS